MKINKYRIELGLIWLDPLTIQIKKLNFVLWEK
jgi:hypothetical protein